MIPSINLGGFDIPPSIDGSWYQGKVFTAFKDAGLKASSLVCRATELLDHSLTYASVELALIGLSLDPKLDVLVAEEQYHITRSVTSL